MSSQNQQAELQRSEQDAERGSRVLVVVEALAQELNPRRRVACATTSSLQHDLGFDSLGLAELLLRTEKEFQVRLPDDLITRLETPQDLIDEIGRASGCTGGVEREKAIRPRAPDFVAFPDSQETLTDVLYWHVRHNAERPHILLCDGYRETETITYGDLARRASSVAAGLRSRGVEPGACVAIMLPTGRDFFEAFYGALLAGAVPVPMYPPMRLSQLEEHLRRQAGILRNSLAFILIAPPEGRALSALLGAQIETLREVVTVDDLRTGGDGIHIRRSPQDLAMLQYTSGSTGSPKGVMLSHTNLLANIRSMGRAIDATSSDVFVSWLPLYHDLGLIGAWLGSLYHAVPTVIMSPLRFIVRPESWLWAIHRNSASLTAAPNFALEFCVNKIGDAALEGLDLSSLRMLANGAEPVSAESIRRFAERFGPYGFRAEAMTPVYGLAENSVGLAFSSLDAEPIVEQVDRASLSEAGHATPAAEDDPQSMSFVSSGVPLPDHEIRIVDELGRESADRQQGRLEFKGPSSTRGYFRDPTKSAALFDGAWLDSGDLAYVSKGQVFITGRVKDIIIKGGRNLYPEEIEEAVGNVPGIRKGCVAAFATADPASGSERLVVVAESRDRQAAARLQLQTSVAETVVDVLGMAADGIVIAPPHAVPKTSSGKIRRSTTRELYETGRLGTPVRALWLQVLRLGLMSALPRVRRLLEATAGVIYAAWFWVVLTLLGAFTWLAVLVVPGRDRRWSVVRATARAGLGLIGIPVRVSGRAHLSTDSGVITANHSSYLDVVVLAAVLPGAPTFVAKSELERQVVAGPFLRRLGALFAVRQDAQHGIREVEMFKQAVQAGAQLVIFPEATFFRMPGLLPFRMGAFTIASATNTPVLPVVLSGTRSILRGGQWFPRRGAVEVEVLEPAEAEGRDFTAAVSLRDRVRAQFLAHCGQPDLAAKDVVFAKEDDV